MVCFIMYNNKVYLDSTSGTFTRQLWDSSVYHEYLHQICTSVVFYQNISDLRLTAFLSHFYIKCIILPRQARDRHRENSKKYAVFPTVPHHDDGDGDACSAIAEHGVAFLHKPLHLTESRPNIDDLFHRHALLPGAAS